MISNNNEILLIQKTSWHLLYPFNVKVFLSKLVRCYEVHETYVPSGTRFKYGDKFDNYIFGSLIETKSNSRNKLIKRLIAVPKTGRFLLDIYAPFVSEIRNLLRQSITVVTSDSDLNDPIARRVFASAPLLTASAACCWVGAPKLYFLPKKLTES